MKKHIKATKIGEIEVETKIYMEECARMRLQLEDLHFQLSS